MTTDTRRRVKLYALNAERQWDDRSWHGTCVIKLCRQTQRLVFKIFFFNLFTK